jgi:chromosome segregation protein
MRLKRLNLHGFKTFAPRTELVFGEGISAIVGPNGSGKSNIADAIRWVLGEQSLSVLRAKKTEDLIFSGSSTRAPLGMAEVSITIDNTDHLLPVSFSEVTITRRAYRSGESEYYINRSRVRLRDVLDIASALGQAYTVVGQGLVDAALSLRPEERRELFEEAAAIRGYYSQREDALRRLTRTEENTARVHDLVVELEPQVRRLERQAKQAEEYGQLQDQLRTLLVEWYARRWRQGVAALHQAMQAEQQALALVEQRKAQVAAGTTALSEARAKVWALVDRVSALQQESARLHAGHASQSQARAVLEERLASARTLQESLVREQEDLLRTLAQVRSRLEQLEAEEHACEREVASLEEAGREVRAVLAALDAQAASVRAEQEREQAQLASLERQCAELQDRLDAVRQRIAEQAQSASQAEAALVGLQQKLASEEAALQQHQHDLSSARQAVQVAEQALAAARSALARARTAQSAVETKRGDLVRRREGLSMELAALTGEQQAGLYGGVRAVVAEASAGRLTGYVGTVSELIRVPAHLEAAIEAALGGRLQEVVVQGWADAERAIAMLKQSGAGRATFLPLDTIRAGAVLPTPGGRGVVGVAYDLVEYDAPVEPVARMLLGRLLVVEDLPSARRILSAMPAGAAWTIATLEGEVVRPGGSITGGTEVQRRDHRAQDRGRNRTILARERRRRELLAALDEADAAISTTNAELERAVAAVRDLEAELARTTGMAEEARKRQMAAQVAVVEQQAARSRVQQEIAWHSRLVEEAGRAVQTLNAEVVQTEARIEELQAQAAPLRERLDALRRRLDALQAERASVAESAGEGHTRLAVLAETLKSIRSRRQELSAELAKHEEHSQALSRRIEDARRAESAITGQLDRLAGIIAGLASRIGELEPAISDAEQQARACEAEAARIEQTQAELQAALVECETAYSHAAVERQRCTGVLETLRMEITEELGIGDSSVPGNSDSDPPAGEHDGEGTPSVEHWPRWNALLASLQSDHAAMTHDGHGQRRPARHTDQSTSDLSNPELERRVYALRARLSRMGPVNPLAVEEHAALAERYEFLQTQLRDLTSAGESLRKVIAELDRTMREQFASTFAQVNEAFQHYFNFLFGGGTARLELTDPQDTQTSGVEILAQPPGKRLQPLAALSGGERALTSAALLFALLKVRPVPFCVLDEVDAALDESNVARFRTALQGLSTHTQFVVITHNRGTIEAADTLYGVSMSGDGTSQLLSLKVVSPQSSAVG